MDRRHTAARDLDARHDDWRCKPARRAFGAPIVRLPDLNGTTTQGNDYITLDLPYPVGDENLVVECRVLANANADESFDDHLERAGLRANVPRFGSGGRS
ncbi:MAG: hypothetical protein IPM29_09860 [Planctomycetes bacterium]|nr:hypothetical protein [Planctomycetota bacterium]